MTVAEWTLEGDGDADWYDGEHRTTLPSILVLTIISVSLVDGFNIPVTVKVSGDCSEASCPKDLNPDCPAELAGPAGANGNAGCKSACFANLDGNQQDSANCCSGSHDTADTCPPDGVDFYDYFSASFLSQSYGKVADTDFRGCVPELVRLRLRRVVWHRSLDLPDRQQGRLYHHLLLNARLYYAVRTICNLLPCVVRYNVIV